MELLGIYNFDIMRMLPLLCVGILFLVLAKSLTLPAEYSKRELIRDAMMKQRAERLDLQRITEMREKMALSDNLDDNEFLVE